jgi:hypothetical protein
LIGIAIDPSRIWEAVKLFTPKYPHITEEAKKQESVPAKGEGDEEP